MDSNNRILSVAFRESLRKFEIVPGFGTGIEALDAYDVIEGGSHNRSVERERDGNSSVFDVYVYVGV